MGMVTEKTTKASKVGFKNMAINVGVKRISRGNEHCKTSEQDSPSDRRCDGGFPQIRGEGATPMP